MPGRDAIELVVVVGADIEAKTGNAGGAHGLRSIRYAVTDPARMELIVVLELADDIGVAQPKAAHVAVGQAPRRMQLDGPARNGLEQRSVERVERHAERCRVAEHPDVGECVEPEDGAKGAKRPEDREPVDPVGAEVGEDVQIEWGHEAV